MREPIALERQGPVLGASAGGLRLRYASSLARQWRIAAWARQLPGDCENETRPVVVAIARKVKTQ
jgi:hypothetical protein